MGENLFKFQVIHQSRKSRARVGKIYTSHGEIDTPGFVAVGTNATLKALDTKTVDEIGLQLMFCNTYHLMVQPGTAVIKQAGGLHTFMGRRMPLITDSGGFQIFSLMYGSVKDELKSRGQKKGNNTVVRVTEEGVLFRSYRDGSLVLLTPERSIQAQKDLGADIIIPLDELPPYHIDHTKLFESLHRTHRWEKRSLDEHIKQCNGQAMYAVIHGGIDPHLRELSCRELTPLPFDGFAIGGSLGKTRDQMFEMLQFVVPRLTENKPNHLLGIGDLLSIGPCIKLGVDTFDSSYPTRSARHGTLFTKQGLLKIGSSACRDSREPIDRMCLCTVCRNYSRAYLQHLFKAREITGYVLATIHNLFFMVELMRNYRERIMQGEL